MNQDEILLGYEIDMVYNTTSIFPVYTLLENVNIIERYDNGQIKKCSVNVSNLNNVYEFNSNGFLIKHVITTYDSNNTLLLDVHVRLITYDELFNVNKMLTDIFTCKYYLNQNVNNISRYTSVYNYTYDNDVIHTHSQARQIRYSNSNKIINVDNITDAKYIYSIQYFESIADVEYCEFQLYKHIDSSKKILRANVIHNELLDMRCNY